MSNDDRRAFPGVGFGMAALATGIFNCNANAEPVPGVPLLESAGAAGLLDSPNASESDIRASLLRSSEAPVSAGQELWHICPRAAS